MKITMGNLKASNVKKVIITSNELVLIFLFNIVFIIYCNNSIAVQKISAKKGRKKTFLNMNIPFLSSSLLIASVLEIFIDILWDFLCNMHQNSKVNIHNKRNNQERS